MNVSHLLESKLATLKPVHLEVINESGNHNVPPGSESHFKVVMVSEQFDGLRPLQRHRMVHELVQAELDGPVHALSLHLYTIKDWKEKKGNTHPSPPCRGGSKHG